MSTCAVCQLSNGLVINLIIAEPTDPAPDGCQLVITPDSTGYSPNIGDTWNGSVFIPQVPNDN